MEVLATTLASGALIGIAWLGKWARAEFRRCRTSELRLTARVAFLEGKAGVMSDDY